MACPTFPPDFGCMFQEQIVALIVSWILPAILFIIALVGIVAARTLKGKALWAVIIFLEVWYFVPVFGFTLRQLLGFGA